MLPRGYEDQNCSIARALEVIGERWTPLIVRDALLGIRRFDDFQARLGISKSVLSERLERLIELGLLERRLYRHKPDRYEYLLTEKGADLWPALNALREWGDRYAAPDGPPRLFVHDRCGTELHATTLCPKCHRQVEREHVHTRPGSGGYSRPATNVPLDGMDVERPLLAPLRGEQPSEPHPSESVAGSELVRVT